MNRRKPLSSEFILSILDVDISTGVCRWKEVSKFHARLKGKVAGCQEQPIGKLPRWFIKIGSVSYKRAYLVFMVAHGYWPALIDHIDGNSLNDSVNNLREATVTQNAWNHRTRAKKSNLPMGIRLNYGKYTVRIGFNRKLITIGTFAELSDAVNAYKSKRSELYGEFSAL